MQHTGAVLVGPLNWGDPVVREGEFLLPVGTVTILLADVVGSSARWEEDEVVMAQATTDLSRVVDEIVGRHNGVRPLEQGEGDSFVAAFARASEAVECAVAIQRSAPLPLRLGIHTGEAQRASDGTYVGPALNRAARVRDAGHAGQVLLSTASAELVADRLPDGVSLRDLGIHHLRDLSRPERIFQLEHASLPSDHPPLRTLDTYRHNLPTQRTSLVGRHHELRRVRELLAESRLVTMTGPGGCGKTRLALQVAASVIDGFPDGVFFVDLAAVTAEDDVARAVARATGFSDEVGNDLGTALGDKRVLSVLDNCEHVIRSCAALCDRLLSACPEVHILATSREPLRVAGESAFVVPALAVPPDGPIDCVEALTPFAAAELFLDRAGRTDVDTVLTDADAPAVARICQRLDGIPLAIELAAARTRVLSPQQIADGLDGRFNLLTGGVRTALPRQQTLTASVDWSYDLLTEPERVVLRRLAVFPGHFTLPSAIATVSGDGVEPHQVLDLVTLLVDKSLVLGERHSEVVRYRMLETIRQYAFDRLGETGEEESTRLRHRDHFLAGAANLQDQLWGPDGLRAYGALAEMADDLEMAFRWSCGRGDATEACRLFAARAGSFSWYGEAMSWSEAVARVVPSAQEPARTDALFELAARPLLWRRTSSEIAAAVDAAAMAARAAGDDRRLARALFARAALGSTRTAEDTAAAAEAATLARAHGDARGAHLAAVAAALWSTAAGARDATDHLDAAIELVRTTDAPVLQYEAGTRLASGLSTIEPHRGLEVSDALVAVGYPQGSKFHRHAYRDRVLSLVYCSRFEEAARLADAIMPEFQRVGDLTCLSILHSCLAAVAAAGGDEARARAHLEKGRNFASYDPEWRVVLDVLLAGYELGWGDPGTAARIVEAVPRDEPRSGALACVIRSALALDQGDVETAERLARDALGEPAGEYFTARLNALILLAAIAVHDGQAAEGLRVAAAVRVYRDRTGYALQPYFGALLDRTMDAASEKVDADSGTAALAEAETSTLHDVVAYLRRGRGPRNRPASGWRSLTPTERQVVDLVGDGLSNKDVAERLFMSARTVSTHLTHVYAKLGVATRAELTAALHRRLAG